ncbi:MAG: ABC transporter ATP-binding protein [Ilumatobacteraceae bacterium]
MSNASPEAVKGSHRVSGATLFALSARRVTKRFPGVLANDQVDFDLAVGEVHTLLGENGAGKSTLASVLCGLYKPDEGAVLRNGTQVRLTSPRHGLLNGIAMVHQHFRLVDRFTVAENVVLGHRRLPFLLRASALESQVSDVAERFGLPIDPRATVGELSAGQRQRVEIVKALYQGAEILLLDEPTALLAPPEVEKLFETVRAMTAAGKSVVFVSHKLGEVVDISDRITVMRDGRVTGSVKRGEADTRRLAELMVGRDINLVRRLSRTAKGEPLLSLDNVTWHRHGSDVVKNISFNVSAGEIVGVAGVSGNGQRELAELVTGLQVPSSGSIAIGGVSINGIGARRVRANGLAYVPEDRLGTGLAPSLTIVDNLVLTRTRGFFVNRRAAQAEAEVFITKLEIKTPSALTQTRKLSGGNAQKVLLAREIFSTGDQSRIIVVCSPTRGLDVGAVETVHKLLDEARSAGKAVLLISEDLDEVLTLADRILVLYRGEVVHEVNGTSVDVEAVGHAMAGLS